MRFRLICVERRFDIYICVWVTEWGGMWTISVDSDTVPACGLFLLTVTQSQQEEEDCEHDPFWFVSIELKGGAAWEAVVRHANLRWTRTPCERVLSEYGSNRPTRSRSAQPWVVPWVFCVLLTFWQIDVKSENCQLTLIVFYQEVMF